MAEAFICDTVRTPIGRYGGALSGVRTDDLAAIPIRTLVERNPSIDWSRVNDVIFGCANQAGEDNRNVARMAALLAGLPVEVSAVTVNRLCGSGMEAVVQAARAVKTGEAHVVIAGGVESMSRAVRDAQGDDRFFSNRGDLRHHHRMALRQPTDEEGLWCRLDARNL
jgi:3-oxoadipyl-CoA thiolase